jgi:hypothetical protein
MFHLPNVTGSSDWFATGEKDRGYVNDGGSHALRESMTILKAIKDRERNGDENC